MSEFPWSRRGFLRVGAGSVFGLLTGCADWFTRMPERGLDMGRVEGSVIVIGAGPAGMTAAHLLQQRGANVRVLEATASYGGRIAHDRDFTDFPISLGAEWIHVDREVLNDAVGDPSIEIGTVTTGYAAEDVAGSWDDDFDLSLEPFPDWPDLKFVASSWLDFFETYVVPGIAPLITYETAVTQVDYRADGVRLTDGNGTTYEADRVVVTAPLKMLQLGLITFAPPLPERHATAITEAKIWSGLKAFIEFDEAFYPTYLAPPDSASEAGQRLYYDAAYGQDTDANILGLFSVGAQAERYQAAGDGVIDMILEELDAVFDGAASRSYRRHMVQNWNDQPYARGAYLEDGADYRISRHLSEPVSDRVFFAGDAYTSFDDWSSVHAAIWSAGDVVRAMQVTPV